jgi:uncharacterized protein (TIGR00369 family)
MTSNASDPRPRIAESFARQSIMATMGASLGAVAPGTVEIVLPSSRALAQQHGSLHAGAIATIADSACGYAALTLMPEGSAVVSVEFKLNLLAPAIGEKFIARARVLRAGRTLTVTAADVFAASAEGEKLIATMLGTMMRVERRGGQAG